MTNKDASSLELHEARARLLRIISKKRCACRSEEVSAALQELFGSGWRIIETSPEGGRQIHDEERIQRIRSLPAREEFGGDKLTIDDFFVLWNEPGQGTLQWLYEKQGVTYIYFGGTTLLSSENVGVYIVLKSIAKSSWFFSGAYAPGYGPDLRRKMQRRHDWP